jgi:hypothetical protein
MGEPDEFMYMITKTDEKEHGRDFFELQFTAEQHQFGNDRYSLTNFKSEA